MKITTLEKLIKLANNLNPQADGQEVISCKVSCKIDTFLEVSAYSNTRIVKQLIDDDTVMSSFCISKADLAHLKALLVSYKKDKEFDHTIHRVFSYIPYYPIPDMVESHYQSIVDSAPIAAVSINPKDFDQIMKTIVDKGIKSVVFQIKENDLVVLSTGDAQIITTTLK